MAAHPKAYIFTNKVTHARFLPLESAHRFTYPIITFLLSLSALENGELDLGGGWLFGYGGLWFRTTGIRPSAYLQPGQQVDGRMSIKQKLLEVLQTHSLDPSLFGDAWILTMPSYFGFEGINPLTVYFCYKKDQSLWVIVLEVHNTFGERHVYVLPIGAEYQDTFTLLGYTFSWTFARQFHVSPFNDRSGFYTCSVVPPPHPPFGVVRSKSTSDESTTSGPSIRIDLHTSDPRKSLQESADDRDLHTRKLLAVVRPASSQHFTSKHLIQVLSKYPFSLFLSFPRIAYEAFRLHYFKGLDVFARPAPRAGKLSIENQLPTPRNPVQQDQKGTLLPGSGVGWQPEGLLQRYARNMVERFLQMRAEEQLIQIELIFADPSIGTRTFRPSTSTTRKEGTTLSIFVRSPQAFVYLFISPSAEITSILGEESEREFAVSDPNLFRRVFTVQTFSSRISLARLVQHIRLFAVPSGVLRASTVAERVHFLETPNHSSKTAETGILLTNILVLLLFYFLLYVEKLAFTLFRARFVAGDEPWKLWSRAAVVRQ